MPAADEYSFTRYLSAKKAIDDRSLNSQVRQSLARAVSTMRPAGPLRVLEIGAGIGTMVERVIEWGLFGQGVYTAIDSESKNIAEATSRVPSWARAQGYSVKIEANGQIRITAPGKDLLVRLQVADVFEFTAHVSEKGQSDVLIANAFLDLIDVRSSLSDILSPLAAGGLFYFTITFDGATIFQPEIDPDLDAKIEALYHETMDRRIVGSKPSGDSRAGRHFFEQIRGIGAEILDAGSSDWLVFAGPNGYPDDEAYFLHFIIHTVGSALRGTPDLDPERFSAWLQQRHAQVDQGTLVYIAHQLDFLGRVP